MTTCAVKPAWAMTTSNSSCTASAVVCGAAADFIQSHKLNAEQARQASEIAGVLPNLVADVRDKDRWTRDELLCELGWRDTAKTLLIHRFPVGA